MSEYARVGRTQEKATPRTAPKAMPTKNSAQLARAQAAKQTTLQLLRDQAGKQAPLQLFGESTQKGQAFWSAEVVQRQIAFDEEEEFLQGKFETVQRVGEDLEEEEPVQMKPENRTGMPDSLKAGVESLSGLAMDEVRVHYNSSRPAEVGALAYTQGTDIHVGPGQERHLPHEAWHVVQQKRGIVRPTFQLKGLAINDDAGLEREASEMETHIKINKFFTREHKQKKCTVKYENSTIQCLLGEELGFFLKEFYEFLMRTNYNRQKKEHLMLQARIIGDKEGTLTDARLSMQKVIDDLTREESASSATGSGLVERTYPTDVVATPVSKPASLPLPSFNEFLRILDLLNPKHEATNLFVIINGTPLSEMIPGIPEFLQSSGKCSISGHSCAEETFIRLFHMLRAEGKIPDGSHILLQCNRSPCPSCTQLLLNLKKQNPKINFSVRFMGIFRGNISDILNLIRNEIDPFFLDFNHIFELITEEFENLSTFYNKLRGKEKKDINFKVLLVKRWLNSYQKALTEAHNHLEQFLQIVQDEIIIQLIFFINTSLRKIDELLDFRLSGEQHE